MRTSLKIVIAGLIGGFISEGFLGGLFVSSFIKDILYNPDLQSQLFLDITPTRNVPISVIGIIVLSIIHAWLFNILAPSMPGRTWIRKGLFWGFAIWAMFWLFQEWFIYHTLLQEPILLNLLELTILLIGSLIEGVVIAWILRKEVALISR